MLPCPLLVLLVCNPNPASPVATLVFGALVLTMTASAALMLVYYFFNLEKEVRERATRFLMHSPLTPQILGQHVHDVSLQHMGSRGMQAHHHFPWVGAHRVSCSYVLQGSRGRAQVHVEFEKNGKEWTLRYLELQSGKYGTHVIVDTRKK